MNVPAEHILGTFLGTTSLKTLSVTGVLNFAIRLLTDWS